MRYKILSVLFHVLSIKALYKTFLKFNYQIERNFYHIQYQAENQNFL